MAEISTTKGKRSYQLMFEGRIQGALTPLAIRTLIEEGRVKGDTPISVIGTNVWGRIDDYLSLRELLKQANQSTSHADDGNHAVIQPPVIDNIEDNDDEEGPGLYSVVRAEDVPLSSAEQAMVVFFLLTCIPATIFLVGMLPVFFIAIGWVLMKKNSQFSNLAVFVTWAKVYIGAIAIISAIVFWLNYTYLVDAPADSWSRRDYRANLWGSFIAGSLASTYFWLLHSLFLKPIATHRNWVSKNGVFSSNQKIAASAQMDIIKGEKLHKYSVADELTKWSNLRTAGHISEADYIEARSKLLRRNVT